LIDLDTAQSFHETVKNHLEEDGYITVTTPMEMKKVNLDGGATVQANIVRQSESNLYTSLGTSQALFNSDKAGNIGLQKNIQVDENYMFRCYRQFERFVNFKLLNQTGKHDFKVNFIDATRFNRKELFETYFQLNQFGYPVEQYVAACVGIEPKDLESLTYFSNVLGLKQKFSLLPSSFTSSNIDKNQDSGRKEKAIDDKSDITLQQQDQGINDDRA
jgi:hypothetical protein